MSDDVQLSRVHVQSRPASFESGLQTKDDLLELYGCREVLLQLFEDVEMDTVLEITMFLGDFERWDNGRGLNNDRNTSCGVGLEFDRGAPLGSELRAKVVYVSLRLPDKFVTGLPPVLASADILKEHLDGSLNINGRITFVSSRNRHFVHGFACISPSAFPWKNISG